MLEPLGDYARSNCCGNVDYRPFDAYAFKLVLNVTCQISECYAKQVCEKWSCESQAFVLEVVFIVWLSFSEFQLDNSNRHFAEEYGFILPVFVASAQVWQEVLVQCRLGFLQAVLFNLSVGNAVTDEQDGVAGVVYTYGFFERSPKLSLYVL